MKYISIRHVKDWTIFPWILTDPYGFEFTWLFLIFGQNDNYEEEDI